MPDRSTFLVASTPLALAWLTGNEIGTSRGRRVANGINDLGQIVGTGTVAADNLDHALMWTAPPTVFGDFDGDGHINALDLAQLLATWGECNEGACKTDLNGDDSMSASDLAMLLAAWTG